MSEQDDVAAVGESIYRTRDLNQAAFLWCQPGASLKKLQPGDDRIVHFVFEIPLCKDDLNLLIFNYANERTVIEPVRFVNNQNKLRDMLYDHKRNEKREKDVNSRN